MHMRAHTERERESRFPRRFKAGFQHLRMVKDSTSTVIGSLGKGQTFQMHLQFQFNKESTFVNYMNMLKPYNEEAFNNMKVVAKYQQQSKI